MIVHSQGRTFNRTDAPRFLAVRLSALIFLAFAVMGAWVPVFSLHLELLNFSPEATAWASAANAIGAMIAPLIWGQIADRWLAIERCISLCAAATGVLLWIMAGLREPGEMIVACMVMWFFLIPVLGLTGAFIFRQLDHPEREYGKIRLWGTVGWIITNWVLTLWFALTAGGTREGALVSDLSDSLRLGAMAAGVLAIYALTMPHTPPSVRSDASLAGSWLSRIMDAPLSALQLFRHHSFLVYCGCMFGLYITMPFSMQLNPLLLKELKVEAAWVPLFTTISQSTEILTLALLPMLLTRFGTKATMMFGGISWTVGMLVLSVNSPLWLVLASFVTHGVFICCFVIAGQVFVNRHAAHDIRASAQGILIFINGSGLLLGHVLVGWIRAWTNDRYDIAFLVALSIAALVVILFFLGFSAEGPVNSPQEALVTDEGMP